MSRSTESTNSLFHLLKVVSTFENTRRLPRYQYTIPTTGTPSDRTGFEGENHEEIISYALFFTRVTSGSFYGGHYP